VIGDGGPNEIGVVGSSDTQEGGLFENGSSYLPALFAHNLSSEHSLLAVNQNNDLAAIYAVNYGGGYDTYFGEPAAISGSAGNACAFAAGSLFCSGDIDDNSDVPGNPEVSPASPGMILQSTAVMASNAWVEDMDVAQLADGSAVVRLNRGLAQVADTSKTYEVFLTPEGDCEGLYISHKTADSFEVHELRGGHHSLAFDYRVVAIKRDHDDVKFRDVTEKVQQRNAAEAASVARARAREKKLTAPQE
jgi:hypothetical protein